MPGKGCDEMQELKNEIIHYFQRIFEAPIWKGAFSFVITILTTLFGQFDSIAKTFITVIILDFITGIVKGIVNKNCNSRTMRQSASKIISYGLSVMIGHFFEQFLIPGARTYVIAMLGVTEVKSVKENLEEIGAKLPEFMSEMVDSWVDLVKKKKPK